MKYIKLFNESFLRQKEIEKLEIDDCVIATKDVSYADDDGDINRYPKGPFILKNKEYKVVGIDIDFSTISKYYNNKEYGFSIIDEHNEEHYFKYNSIDKYSGEDYFFIIKEKLNK